MAYQRLLTVQDISCLGQCSMTVALPILSACGHETCILPTMLLSTHTGGFVDVHKQGLTDQFPGILEHWKRSDIVFDGVYTGYLGKTEQIDWVRKIFSEMVVKNGRRIVDPAMADGGKLYGGFDGAYVEAMKRLCADADVIVPNITEACLLTDTPCRETVDEEFVLGLLQKLAELCPCTVLTGVGFSPEETGVAVYRNGQYWRYAHPRESKSFHGTGDIFASALVGAWHQEKTLEEAVKIAADFTVSCIRKTVDCPAHWYGVKFEAALPELVQKLFMSDL